MNSPVHYMRFTLHASRFTRGTLHASRFTLHVSRGFTLLEVLIALALVGLLLFPLMRIFSAGGLTGASTEMRTIALGLAQEKMEGLRASGFAAVAAEARAAVPYSGFGSYEREVVLNSSTADLKDVSVFVYWSVENRDRQMELRTLFANY